MSAQAIDIQRKPVKRLCLKINTHTGELRITAPLEMPESVIREFIQSKSAWIERHKKRVAIPPCLQFTTGEMHYLMGDSYSLRVIEADRHHGVTLIGDSMLLIAPPNASLALKLQIINEWYRIELKKRIPSLVDYWQKKMNIPLVEWRIKKMKTRWGTCNPFAKRIWLSLELAKKNEQCLEYVIVHELVHFFERSHNCVFKAYMDKFLPEWRTVRVLLNKPT